MPYMLLIVEPVGQRETRTEQEGRQAYQRMLDWSASLDKRGLLRDAQSLRSLHDGARVQMRAGKRTLVDGPFAEAREMVGGYFLLDCATRTQAIAIASECPAAEWATVEIRELGPCYT